MLAHAPHLLEPFLGWAAALALNGSLRRREHEIVALRIAHLCGSAFEWDEHVGFALEAGLTAQEIERIRAFPDSSPDDELDRVLLDATDQLHSDALVNDETYDRLAKFFTPSQLVEIPMVAGQYAMLSMLTGFTSIPGIAGTGSIDTTPTHGQT